MRATIGRALSIGAAALVAVAGNATIASAQAQAQQQLPKGWSYDIRSGQRVAKTNRVSNADGSWREEARQGNCVTVKERSATGEYKTSSECTPAKPQ
jgi:hypothetical protein